MARSRRWQTLARAARRRSSSAAPAAKAKIFIKSTCRSLDRRPHSEPAPAASSDRGHPLPSSPKWRGRRGRRRARRRPAARRRCCPRRCPRCAAARASASGRRRHARAEQVHVDQDDNNRRGDPRLDPVSAARPRRLAIVNSDEHGQENQRDVGRSKEGRGGANMYQERSGAFRSPRASRTAVRPPKAAWR